MGGTMTRRKQGWTSTPEGGAPFHSPFAGLAVQPAVQDEKMPAAAAAAAAAVSMSAEPSAPLPPEWSKMALQLHYERKGRAGKTVTLVAGFASERDARAAADLLRRGLGCGAQVEGEQVALQGDQRERAAVLLRKQGVRCLAG